VAGPRFQLRSADRPRAAVLHALHRGDVRRAKAHAQAFVGRSAAPAWGAGGDTGVEIGVRDEAVVVVGGFAMVVTQQQRGVAAERQPCAQARIAVVAVHAGLEARALAIAQEGVLLAGADGGAQGQGIVHRNVDHAFELAVAVGARLESDAAFQQRGRGVRDHVHQAGRGVAAIQGALRPAQYFDAVDVEEVGGLAGRARDVHAVLHEGGRRVALVGGVVVADAADGHAQAREGLVDVHVGQARAQRCRIVGAEFAQLLTLEYAHGDRGARGGGDGALRRDHDFRDGVVLFLDGWRFLRLDGVGAAQAPGNTRYCDGQQLLCRTDLLYCHEGLPLGFSCWRIMPPCIPIILL